MTGSEIAGAVRRIIVKIAPDVDEASIQPDEDLRTTLGIDSFDHLRIMTAIAAEFQIPIAEQQYGQLYTLAGIVRYIAAHAAH